MQLAEQVREPGEGRSPGQARGSHLRGGLPRRGWSREPVDAREMRMILGELLEAIMWNQGHGALGKCREYCDRAASG